MAVPTLSSFHEGNLQLSLPLPPTPPQGNTPICADQSVDLRQLDISIEEFAEETEEQLRKRILAGIQLYSSMSREEMDAITHRAVAAARELLHRNKNDPFALAYTLYLQPEHSIETLRIYINHLRQLSTIDHHFPYYAIAKGLKSIYHANESGHFLLVESVNFLELAIASCDEEKICANYHDEAMNYYTVLDQNVLRNESSPLFQDDKIYSIATACRLLEATRHREEVAERVFEAFLFNYLRNPKIQNELGFYSLFTSILYGGKQSHTIHDIAQLLWAYKS